MKAKSKADMRYNMKIWRNYDFEEGREMHCVPNCEINNLQSA